MSNILLVPDSPALATPTPIVNLTPVNSPVLTVTTQNPSSILPIPTGAQGLTLSPVYNPSAIVNVDEHAIVNLSCIANGVSINVVSSLSQLYNTFVQQHNALDGLQGGIFNERYHLSKAQFDVINSAINATGSFVTLTGNQDIQGIKIFRGGLQSFTAPVLATDVIRLQDLGSYVLTSGGTMTGLLTLSGNPINAFHAVPKNYVDNLITGVVWAGADVATVGNIVLSGEQVIDTVTTSSSRVLVLRQTDATQNGLYISSTTAWTRAPNATTGSQLKMLAVIVEGGNTNISTQWLNSNSTITLGTTNISFTRISGTGSYTSGAGINMVANVFSIDLTYTNQYYPQLVSTYANPSWISTLAWSKIINTPTTIAGYGITDVISTLLTGFVSTTGVITQADSILQSIQKLNGNLLSLSNNGTYVNQEIPSGAIDGLNRVYILSHPVVLGTESVFLNGLLQFVTLDYTITNSTITFNTTPYVGDTIRVTYFRT